jgi:uroporphyrinogen III methyltransferase/synthase
MTTAPRVKPATVYLVGAGPGDPGLITIRAVECLKLADLVLYDYLANPAVLEHASPNAELMCLGHHRTGRTLSPDEITTRMVEQARTGRTVVRLKGGDPSIFGRGSDEAEALRSAGIPFEIVPGITTALAAAALCEIPITHHEDASAVAFVTGRERDGKSESQLNQSALAAFPGTLVIYMGVKRAERWCRELIEHGKPPETPVAIVRWVSRAQQHMVRCTLATVADVIRRDDLRPPAVFIVGDVVDRVPPRSWFTERPLYGTRMLVLGAPAGARELRDRLAALGADVILQPTVRITDPTDWAPVDAALDRLDEYDWLLFPGVYEIDFLIRRVLDRGGDVRRFADVKLATVGSSAAERLTSYHLRSNLVIEQSDADSLTEAVQREMHDRRVLSVGGGHDRSALGESLPSVAARVDEIAVHDSVDVEAADPEVAEALHAGAIDWVVVMSPAAADSLVRRYGCAFGGTPFLSIGPGTSAALRNLGCAPVREASRSTTEGLVEAILDPAVRACDHAALLRV